MSYAFSLPVAFGSIIRPTRIHIHRILACFVCVCRVSRGFRGRSATQTGHPGISNHYFSRYSADGTHPLIGHHCRAQKGPRNSHVKNISRSPSFGVGRTRARACRRPALLPWRGGARSSVLLKRLKCETSPPAPRPRPLCVKETSTVLPNTSYAAHVCILCLHFATFVVGIFRV